MIKLRPVRLSRIHIRNQTFFPQADISPLSLSNINDDKLSPQKESIFQIFFSNLTVFSASPTKSRNDSEIRSKVLTRNSTRVESLDNLMKKCNDFNEEVKSTKQISMYNKEAGKSIKRIRKSLNLYSDNSHEISSKGLKKDAQVLNDHLSLATKNLKTARKVWKFSSRNISKKTEKLMEQVKHHLTSMKRLRKVFACN